MEQFLQENVPIKHLLNAKPLFMSWQRSTFNEVNDWPPKLYGNVVVVTLFYFQKPSDDYSQVEFSLDEFISCLSCSDLKMNEIFIVSLFHVPRSLLIRSFIILSWKFDPSGGTFKALHHCIFLFFKSKHPPWTPCWTHAEDCLVKKSVPMSAVYHGIVLWHTWGRSSITLAPIEMSI